jgi:hypothetical protein
MEQFLHYRFDNRQAALLRMPAKYTDKDYYRGISRKSQEFSSRFRQIPLKIINEYARIKIAPEVSRRFTAPNGREDPDKQS